MSKSAYIRLPSGTVIETETPSMWTEGQRITATEGRSILRNDAIASLKACLKPGNTVYTILRSVSRSGMRRSLSVYIITSDGQPWDVTGTVCRATGRNTDRNNNLTVDGCGMDMGFHVVYGLGMTLWPDGTTEPHGTRDGEPDSSGGYALKHRWL